jgi:hypothetical protein
MAFPCLESQSTARVEIQNSQLSTIGSVQVPCFFTVANPSGPAAPIELDTFLEPLVAELLELHDGVSAYDAYQQENFVLHCHLVLITGDTPAILKGLHLTGHNGYSPC